MSQANLAPPGLADRSCHHCLHAPHADQAHCAMQEVERPNVRRGKQVQVSKTPGAMTQKQVGLDHSGRK